MTHLTPPDACIDAYLHRRRGTLPGYEPLRWLRSRISRAHSQGETLEELNDNLKEVITMLLDDGAPAMEGEYVGTQTVVVA